jgi:aspartate/methionine/tyrosine aminotransferase
MPPEFLVENMRQTIAEGMNNHYTMFSGHPLLREKISKHFAKIVGRESLDPNSEVLVTNGAIGAIYSTIMNLVQAGDEVLMFEPYYTQYVNHIEFAGAKIVTAPMFQNDDCEWQFDFDVFQ